MRKSTVREYSRADTAKGFHAAVSLHAHTHHSREGLADLPAYIARIPLVAARCERELRAYVDREGQLLDFSQWWWHPPLGPRAVFESEARQIEDRLGLWPLVSITDHDTVMAGFDLQRFYACRCAPISFEWTVPYGRGYFHLGVHNLPAGASSEWFSRLTAFTARRSSDRLGDLLADLSRQPDLLVVFNHPCWDLAGIGDEEHAKQLRCFVSGHRSQIHALELNGYRSSGENVSVQTLARTTGLPVISGGDRHGCAANALLNVTRAETFAEFAVEVRDGVSDVVVMPEYRQPLAVRMLAAAVDVMRSYRSYPVGRRHWTDRVSWETAGTVRPLSYHWPRGGPLWVRGGVAALRAIGSPIMLRVIRVALEAMDGVDARTALGTAVKSDVATLGLRSAN